MIRGHKPAAWTVTGDGAIKIEGEQRQCIHCQFCWDYRPGSGDRRGYCLHCDGFLCLRPECEMQQRAMLAQFAHLSGATDRHCIPFTDYVERQREDMKKSGFAMSPGGVLVPVEVLQNGSVRVRG